jgi:pimeloyl-ACP methyl ester carboxylesterase
VAGPITSQWFSGVNGVRLVADVGGDARLPTVVLMHGGGQTRHSWGAAMKALVEVGYHVINYDACGHGESAWNPDGAYSVEARSFDLRSVLSDIQTPCALVGASMGGITAIHAACKLRQPRIAALVLVDIVARPSAQGVERIRRFMSAHLDGFESISEAIDAVVAYNPHRLRQPDPNGILRNLREAPNGKLKWHWDPRLLSLTAESENRALEEALAANPLANRVPTLLIRGALSDVVSDDGIADLKRHIPQLEVVDVPNAGHTVSGDQNDAFISNVVHYVRRQLPI